MLKYVGDLSLPNSATLVSAVNFVKRMYDDKRLQLIWLSHITFVVLTSLIVYQIPTLSDAHKTFSYRFQLFGLDYKCYELCTQT